MPKVHIVTSSSDYVRMFQKWGWDVVNSIQDADLVQFTGGADVSPYLYNQERHETTYYDSERDKREIIMFKIAKKMGKPMIGICRGGQFLNVMCGGSMFQNVDNHTGRHEAFDTRTGVSFPVTSTHHQMMIAGPGGQVIVTARESTKRQHCGRLGQKAVYTLHGYQKNGDTEAVLYEKDRIFCFQPHPEYSYVPGLDLVYMTYLEEFFGFTSLSQAA